MPRLSAIQLICCSIKAQGCISQKSLDENPISQKKSRRKDLALSASDSSLLTADCKEVADVRNVAGEGKDFAVGLRNMTVCVVSVT